MAQAAAAALITTATAASTAAATGATLMLFGTQVTALTYFLATTAIGAAINALTPKPKTMGQGYNVTATGSALAYQVVYGRAKVAPVRVFDAVTGKNNKYLHRVLAFTGHEIDAFQEIYINDAKITSFTDSYEYEIEVTGTLSQGRADPIDHSFTVRLLAPESQDYPVGSISEANYDTLYAASKVLYSTLQSFMGGNQFTFGTAEITNKTSVRSVDTVEYPDGTTSDRYKGYIHINEHLGAEDQTADSTLVANVEEWTTEHRLRGISYLYVRMEYKAKVFPNGIPEITSYVRGKKVYNPATGNTAFSSNPALCIRDYLTNTEYGLGEGAANIDDDLVATAFNICKDTNTADSTARFTCNGSFTTDSTASDVLSNLLSSMGGLLWYGQGKWRMKAAAWSVPTLSLDEDDLRSSVSVSTRHSRSENFNIIRGTFRGPETNHQVTDFTPVRNHTSANNLVVGYPYAILEVGDTDWNAVAGTTGVTYSKGDVIVVESVGSGTGVADFNLGIDNGQEQSISVDLPFCRAYYQVRRVARIMLERNRQQLSVEASFGLKAFQCQVGDIITLSLSRFGWTNKEFEVVGWTFGLVEGSDLQVNLKLREISENVFDEVDDGAALEFDNTNLGDPFDVDTPIVRTPVVDTHYNDDKVGIPFILFGWDMPDPDGIDYYEFGYSLAGKSAYTNIKLDANEFLLTPAQHQKEYNYRVRAVNYLGVVSDYATGSLTPVKDTVAPKVATITNALSAAGSTYVSWTAPTQNTDNTTLTDLSHYDVYRGTSTNPTTKVGQAGGNSYSEGGLSGDQTYYYRVKAVDTSGNASAYSNNYSITTPPDPIDGQTGASTNIIFKRNATQPDPPDASSGVPTGWVDDAANATGTALLWASSGVKSVGSTTFTWSTPFQVEGKAVAEVAVYRLNTGGTPVGGEFNFTTNEFDTLPTGWLTNPPALGSNGDTVYRASGVVSGSPKETAAEPTWGASVIYAKRVDGTDGVDGDDGSRGAGWWRYDDGSHTTSYYQTSTQTRVNSAFSTHIGLTPVEGDRFIISCTDDAIAFIYESGSWVTQAEFIDGNLLVNGTVTASRIKINNIVLEDGDNNGTLDIIDDSITKFHTVTQNSRTSIPLNGTWLNCGSVIVPVKKNSKHTWIVSTSADSSGSGNVYAAVQLRLERYVTNNGNAGDGSNGLVKAVNFGIMDNGANTAMGFSKAEIFGNVVEQNFTYQLLAKVVDKTSGVTGVYITSTGLVGIQGKR